MRVFAVVVALLVSIPGTGVPRALGQHPAAANGAPAEMKVPVYEAVSIRENRTAKNGSMIQQTDTGFRATNVSLLNLLRNAYDTRKMTDEQIVGVPGWARKIRFDIEAKVEDAEVARLKDLSQPDRREMVRQMLTDRFNLVAHRETREGAVYDLVVGKKGARLEVTKVYAAGVEHESGYVTMNSGSIDAVDGNMETLAMMLTSEVGRPVYNKTGLSGQYDFKLSWTPEKMADAGPAKAESTGVDAPPPLFVALQEQLGLRLDAQRGTVETLVLERVEMPSAN